MTVHDAKLSLKQGGYAQINNSTEYIQSTAEGKGSRLHRRTRKEISRSRYHPFSITYDKATEIPNCNPYGNIGKPF
jgi:hypothetical protein